MPRLTPAVPEFAVPVASLAAMRGALAADVGPDAAARALQAAGSAAGDALYELIARRNDPPTTVPADAAPATESDTGAAVARMAQAVFWRRLSDLFASRGWGRLQHAPAHPGIGMLESADWVEADPSMGAARPSCFFTTGLLANLLGRAAGEPVGVLEVECRSRGDLRCRFALGGRAALQALYADMAAGRDADSALADLV